MQENKSWARAQAKKLKAFLKSQGVELAHKQCLEAVAAMHSAKNWQTFEASSDADIEVRDVNALRSIAETALQATLFKALPEGQTLTTLKTSLLEAKSVEEAGEEWRDQKSRMNALWGEVVERDLCAPPIELPRVMDEALAAIQKALVTKLIGAGVESSTGPVLVHRMVDWRVSDGEGDNIPETDRRTYALTASVSGASAMVNLAYPHSSPAALDVNAPQLGIGIEVNGGLPCAHFYTDIYDGDALMSVFAARNGELIVRLGTQADAATGHPLYQKLSLEAGAFVLKTGR